MPLIVLGVSFFGGFLAIIEITRNHRMGPASSCLEADGSASVIKLPADIEREKRRQHII